MPEGDFAPTSACVVGGRGRMGRWLVPRLAAAGLEVAVADAAEGPWDPAVAARCGVLVLAVPVTEVAGVAQRLGPHLDPGSLVMDLTSLKTAPLAAMLEHCPCQVVGCHPLFGPDTRSARGQVVFLCPGRGAGGPAWAQAFWRGLGARVEKVSPDRHDRLMAQVQSLRHLVLAALGLALAQAGFDPRDDLELAGPWTGELLAMLGNQARQPAGLYAGLASANPELPAVLQGFTAALERMQKCLAAGDTGRLEDMITAGSQLVADQSNLSLDCLRALG